MVAVLAITKLAPMTSIPVATTSLVPTRRTREGLSCAAPISTTAIGATRSPAWTGEYPSTSWRYWVLTNRKPNSPKKTTVTDKLAAVKRGLRKKRRSSMGWLLRISTAAKAASTATPTAMALTVDTEDQP